MLSERERSVGGDGGEVVQKRVNLWGSMLVGWKRVTWTAALRQARHSDIRHRENLEKRFDFPGRTIVCACVEDVTTHTHTSRTPHPSPSFVIINIKSHSHSRGRRQQPHNPFSGFPCVIRGKCEKPGKQRAKGASFP